MGYLIVVFLFFILIFNVFPKYAYLYIIRGTKLIENGEVEKGLLLFEKGASSKQVNLFTKVRYAFLELKFGSLQKAKKMLSLVINDKKTDKATKYDAKAIYALVAFKEGNLSDAKEIMLEVYENHKNTNIYCTLGYLFNLLEPSERAVEFNLEAYEYNKDHHVIHDNLGQSYYLNGENEKAKEIYEDLIEKKPNFPEAYYNYGLVLLQDHQKEQALKMFEEALQKPFNQLTTVTKEEIETEIKNANL